MLSERLHAEVEAWYREGMNTDDRYDNDPYGAELEQYETQNHLSYDYSWDRA